MSRQRLRGLFMSELENIDNSQEVETIPTETTTEELQENVEQLKA